MKGSASRWPLVIWFGLLTVAALSLRGISVSHDITQFMPSGASDRQQSIVELLRAGPTTRMILIGLEGGSSEQLADTSRRLARALAANDKFTHVANGDVSAQVRTLERLFDYRYLLDSGASRSPYSVTELRRELQLRLAELGGALPLNDRRHLASDPTGSFRHLLASWMPTNQPTIEHGVWFSSDRKRALLLATTAHSGFDSAAQHNAVATIKAAFEDARASPKARLILSGAPVFAVIARQTIRSQLTELSVASGILIGLYLLVAYRSSWVLLLSTFPLLTAVLAGATTVSVLFGALHGITLVFGITLLGVAIDYPIHLFSHHSMTGDGHRAIEHIWQTLRLGVFTTCIGYLTFAQSNFQGLAQLGVFATTGLIAAATVTRWVLPVLLAQHPIAPPGTLARRSASGMLGMSRRLALATAVLAIVASMVCLVISPPQWENDLQALSPLSARERQLDNELRQQVGGPELSRLIVVYGDSPDEVLRRSELLAKRLDDSVNLGLIEKYDMAARYLPSRTTQQQRQGALPDDAKLRRQLQQAMQGLPFQQDAFDPFVDAMKASRSLPTLDYWTALNTPLAAPLQPLLYQNAQGWHGLVTLSGIRSAVEFERWWEKWKPTGADYLDLKRASDALLTGFRNDTLDRLLVGFLGILAVVGLGLRSPQAALMTLLPVVLATGLTVCVLGVLGERLSMFHLVALLLTAGIGIDYSLFFHRRELARDHCLATAHALSICAVSTFTVFAILSISPIPVLHAIGLVVALGVPLCFLLGLASSRLIALEDECLTKT